MKNRKENERWRDFMTPEDYRLVTRHMDKRNLESFNNGFDDANQLMGLASFSLRTGGSWLLLQ